MLAAYEQFDEPTKAEQKVLGFRLDQLTTALVSEWNLSPMLEHALKSIGSKKADENAISIGTSIADNIHRGWESQKVNDMIGAAIKLLNLSASEAKDYVYESARIATDGLKSFNFPHTQTLYRQQETRYRYLKK